MFHAIFGLTTKETWMRGFLMKPGGRAPSIGPCLQNPDGIMRPELAHDAKSITNLELLIVYHKGFKELTNSIFNKILQISLEPVFEEISINVGLKVADLHKGSWLNDNFRILS